MSGERHQTLAAANSEDLHPFRNMTARCVERKIGPKDLEWPLKKGEAAPGKLSRSESNYPLQAVAQVWEAACPNYAAGASKATSMWS